MSVPVCVKCKKEMRCSRNAVWWIKTRTVEKVPSSPDCMVISITRREPCKATMGDKYRCDGCGCEVITGFALKSNHSHEQGFTDLLEGAHQCGDELIYES